MKKTINTNENILRKNKVLGRREPPISVKTHKGIVQRGNTVVIYGQDGKEAARMVYSPDKPRRGGATVWVETQNSVEVVE